MKSRPPKSNQLLSLSQWYIYANLQEIYQPVPNIFHLQDFDLEYEVKVTKD